MNKVRFLIVVKQLFHKWKRNFNILLSFFYFKLSVFSFSKIENLTLTTSTCKLVLLLVSTLSLTKRHEHYFYCLALGDQLSHAHSKRDLSDDRTLTLSPRELLVLVRSVIQEIFEQRMFLGLAGLGKNVRRYCMYQSRPLRHPACRRKQSNNPLSVITSVQLWSRFTRNEYNIFITSSGLIKTFSRNNDNLVKCKPW